MFHHSNEAADTAELEEEHFGTRLKSVEPLGGAHYSANPFT